MSYVPLFFLTRLPIVFCRRLQQKTSGQRSESRRDQDHQKVGKIGRKSIFLPFFGLFYRSHLSLSLVVHTRGLEYSPLSDRRVRSRAEADRPWTR